MISRRSDDNSKNIKPIETLNEDKVLEKEKQNLLIKSNSMRESLDKLEIKIKNGIYYMEYIKNRCNQKYTPFRKNLRYTIRSF
jgi:hypothetical protein